MPVLKVLLGINIVGRKNPNIYLEANFIFIPDKLWSVSPGSVCHYSLSWESGDSVCRVSVWHMFPATSQLGKSSSHSPNSPTQMKGLSTPCLHNLFWSVLEVGEGCEGRRYSAASWWVQKYFHVSKKRFPAFSGWYIDLPNMTNISA